jgi:hypothetical protein
MSRQGGIESETKKIAVQITLPIAKQTKQTRNNQ